MDLMIALTALGFTEYEAKVYLALLREHPATGYQIGKGLFGAIIIRAADDPLPSIPEKLIILADQRFRDDGAIDFADERSMQGQIDLENGREGDVIFANGRVKPMITIRSGEVQRWRVINASASRVYRLSIPGQKLVLVGSDGGLFEHPEEVDDVVPPVAGAPSPPPTA